MGMRTKVETPSSHPTLPPHTWSIMQAEELWQELKRDEAEAAARAADAAAARALQEATAAALFRSGVGACFAWFHNRF